MFNPQNKVTSCKTLPINVLYLIKNPRMWQTLHTYHPPLIWCHLPLLCTLKLTRSYTMDRDTHLVLSIQYLGCADYFNSFSTFNLFLLCFINYFREFRHSLNEPVIIFKVNSCHLLFHIFLGSVQISFLGFHSSFSFLKYLARVKLLRWFMSQ